MGTHTISDLKTSICLSDAEFKQVEDGVVEIENVISWVEDSFGWAMGEQSGSEKFLAADEIRTALFKDNAIELSVCCEYSTEDAEGFSIELPEDDQSDEYCNALDIAEKWLTGAIDRKPMVVA